MRRSREIAREAVEERGAMQKPRELELLLDILRARPVGNVVEIGGNHGGTTWAWGQVATGRLLCVDLFVLDGRMEHAGTKYKLIEGDSHQPETRDRVERFLRGEPLDFLFIDGDHSLDGVWADWELYSPLVAEGGVIGIHDVSIPHENREAHNVIPFWEDVRSRYPHAVLYDPTFPTDPALAWGGIGVLFP